MALPRSRIHLIKSLRPRVGPRGFADFIGAAMRPMANAQRPSHCRPKSRLNLSFQSGKRCRPRLRYQRTVAKARNGRYQCFCAPETTRFASAVALPESSRLACHSNPQPRTYPTLSLTSAFSTTLHYRHTEGAVTCVESIFSTLFSFYLRRKSPASLDGSAAYTPFPLTRDGGGGPSKRWFCHFYLRPGLYYLL